MPNDMRDRLNVGQHQHDETIQGGCQKVKKLIYYILSLTWGLPMTLIGLLGGAALLLMGYKPKRWLYGYYFEVGRGWGGFNAGPIFFCSERSSKSLKNHEFGHSLQNCVYGVFTLFIVCIPSVIRYWYREIRERRGLKNKTDYDAIWFEGQATEWGERFYWGCNSNG